jgi:hypothetical protein
VTEEQFVEVIRLLRELHWQKAGEFSAGLGVGAIIGAISAGIGVVFLLAMIAQVAKIRTSIIEAKACRECQEGLLKQEEKEVG